MSGTQMEWRHGLFPDLVDWFGAGFPRFPVGRPTIDVHPIPVEGDTPAIGAEHTENRTEKEHSEFRYRSFRRSVRLQAEIPTEGVEAAYEDGIHPPVAVSAPHRSGPG
ncbi:Hsp20/alpha crystallin family protein [Streptomyces sp. NPDC051020]|uniref:Hsp20/alpha crystallin family protein n=1 Tax=Streptomyces sp. NPDC051020 TaxID=3155409 RepID=UPI0034304784